jgi:hypothetical protein
MNNYKRFVSYFTSFSIGFFTLPYLFYILNTTLNIILKPEAISDGIAIIYVSLLGSLYYLLAGHGSFNFKDDTLTEMLIIFIGLLTFIFSLEIKFFFF